MRAVVQRVRYASVTVAGQVVGQIDHGLLVLLGVGPDDTPADAEYLQRKLLALRIFSDANDKMNMSVQDVQGGILVVSQFTLWGDVRKGHRPSFAGAAPPQQAQQHYDLFLNGLTQLYPGRVQAGRFGAHMEVELLNDGPVTLWIDTQHR